MSKRKINLADDFEVRHIHRELQLGKQSHGNETQNDDVEFKMLYWLHHHFNPGYDPYNYIGSRL